MVICSKNEEKMDSDTVRKVVYFLYDDIFIFHDAVYIYTAHFIRSKFK